MSKKKSLQVYLDAYDRAVLDSLSKSWGCSLSSAIKRVLRERPEAIIIANQTTADVDVSTSEASA